jgi:hypothetical protein
MHSSNVLAVARVELVVWKLLPIVTLKRHPTPLLILLLLPLVLLGLHHRSALVVSSAHRIGGREA